MKSVQRAGWFSRMTSRRGDRKFAAQLSQDLKLLFATHDARVVQLPNSDYREGRNFDDARALAVTSDLHLRFQRVRGQLEILAASPVRPDGWIEVGTLLTWLDNRQNLAPVQYPNFSDSEFAVVDQFLSDKWRRLVTAAAGEV